MEGRVLDLSHGVGAAVRALRVDAHLSQSELADRVGTTQSAVSRWERGHDEPRLSTLGAIARACGHTLSLAVDDGVDRAQIREHLTMSPADRLRAVTNLSRLRAAARAVRG